MHYPSAKKEKHVLAKQCAGGKPRRRDRRQEQRPRAGCLAQGARRSFRLWTRRAFSQGVFVLHGGAQNRTAPSPVGFRLEFLTFGLLFVLFPSVWRGAASCAGSRFAASEKTLINFVGFLSRIPGTAEDGDQQPSLVPSLELSTAPPTRISLTR